MAAITVASYQTIANQYANAQAQVAGVSDYYYLAAYEIVILQVFDPELDLLAPFYNAYLAAQTVFLQAPQAVITAVNSLQSHVLDKARTDPLVDTTNGPARFSTINQWIDAAGTNDAALHDNLGRQNDVDTSFTVRTEFATLSSQAGFSIVDGNIT